MLGGREHRPHHRPAAQARRRPRRHARGHPRRPRRDRLHDGRIYGCSRRFTARCALATAATAPPSTPWPARRPSSSPRRWPPRRQRLRPRAPSRLHVRALRERALDRRARARGGERGRTAGRARRRRRAAVRRRLRGPPRRPGPAHPVPYVQGLAAAVHGDGSEVLEQTRATRGFSGERTPGMGGSRQGRWSLAPTR